VSVAERAYLSRWSAAAPRVPHGTGEPFRTSGPRRPAPPARPPPIALSAAETARIERLARDWKAGILSLARLAFHLRWSVWRRRHQARARWHHYAARLAVLAT
jgi:hypothetical protein